MASAHSNGVPTDLISVSEVASICGVCIQSVRNWTDSGDLTCYRLGPAAWRRYSRREVVEFATGEANATDAKRAIIYARVSGHKQNKMNGQGSSDLTRQVQRLREYAQAHYSTLEVVEYVDVGSGLNFLRKSLGRLLDAILAGQLDNSVLILEHRDRVARWGVEIVERICSAHSIEVVYVEQQELNDEEMLSADLLSIIHVFSTRSYAKRSAERSRKILSTETIERGLELFKKGLSLKDVIDQLNAEGYRTEDGATLKFSVVRKNIYLKWAKLKQVATVKVESSVQEWKRQFVQSGNDNVRLPFSSAYEHYARWAKGKNLIVCSRAKFSVECQDYKLGYMRTDKSYRCWFGVQIRNANLHIEVRPHRAYQLKETPTDSLLRFIKGITFNGCQTDLIRKYNSFCASEEIEPLSKAKVAVLISQMGYKKTRRKGQLIVNIA